MRSLMLTQALQSRLGIGYEYHRLFGRWCGRLFHTACFFRDVPGRAPGAADRRQAIKAQGRTARWI